MKLCGISDLHGRLPVIPECDVLVIAGDTAPDLPFSLTLFDPDLCRVGQMKWYAKEYFAWEQTVPAKHIFMTPGNHDWVMYLPEQCRTQFFVDAGTSVRDELTNEDITFWFTPWVSPIGYWNYMLPRPQRAERFHDIPEGVDVLVAHSPAFRVGDRTWNNDRAGCPELRGAIGRARPQHVFFGHIHEGRRDGDDYQLGTTQLHNVAYRENSPPKVIDVYGRDL